MGKIAPWLPVKRVTGGRHAVGMRTLGQLMKKRDVEYK